MRYLGAIRVTLAGAGLGLRQRGALWARVRTLSALSTALELMRAEILDRLTPLPELAGRMQQAAPEAMRPFFRALSAQMDALGEEEPGRLWRQAAEETLARQLTDYELAQLCAPGEALGRFEAQEQGDSLQRAQRFFTQAAEEARCTAVRTGRVYLSLGTATGAMLAIVLL